MKSFLTAVAFCLIAQFAYSAPVTLEPCADVGATLENMLMGAQHQRSFYKGAVGLVAFDAEEPAAASYVLAVIFKEPIENEGYSARKCVAVNLLSGVDLKGATWDYNPASGLTVFVPVKRPDAEGTSVFKTLVLKIKTINTGTSSEGHVVDAQLN